MIKYFCYECQQPVQSLDPTVGDLQVCPHCGFPCIVPQPKSKNGQPVPLVAKSFFRLSAKRQAQMLGIPFEEIAAERKGKKWISPFSGNSVGPEQVVLDAYENLGWIGESWHGFSLRTLQEAICQHHIRHHSSLSFLTMFFGQITTELWVACGCGKWSDLINLPMVVDERTIRLGFKKVVAYYQWAGTYGDVIPYAAKLETCVLGIWRILGKQRMKILFELQLGGDHVKYYTGWPDLTLVRGNELRFVEVKTTDHILPQQYEILAEVAPRLELDCCIAQVSPCS